LGASAEETRWELPRLRAEYTNRSLFGGLRRLELASTVGYAFVPNIYQYDPSHSGITTVTSAQITVPNIIRPGLEWVSRVEFAREVQSGHSYNDIAARSGLLYRRGPHTVGASLNFVRYFSVAVQGLTGFDQLNISGAQIVRDCGTGCTLTYPELRYSYDGRDNLIEPTQGFFGAIGLQQTLKPGSFSYFRINPDLRAYAPLTRYAVLAVRAEYGGLFNEIPGDPTPFTQRFFFGGQNEQRGYAALRQGPKLSANPVCTVGVDPGCIHPYATVAVPAGGTAATLFSAELRIHADWILNHLGIVPFIDASSVGRDPKRPLAGGLEFAPGLGLRYVTPFGPIRVDVAYLLNPHDVYTDPLVGTDKTTLIESSRVSAFCPGNTAGCIRESRWAFHVSLGEAF
jgi:translocation and assembly module TamA